ncbi:MAG: DUF2752 domain-containing protein [Acidobacteria bacterium]|nr:DUF2752 domain-containing protein [Acidobacteriota bacterium]
MTVEWRRLGPGELDHELLWSAVGLAAAGLLAILALTPLTPPLVCPLSALAGVPCPTCGSTRALLALGEGRWLAAFRFNPLTTLAVTLSIPWLAHGAVASLLRLPRLRLRPDAAERHGLRLLAWLAIAGTWVFLIVDGR